jgi:hypothetical protein
MSADPQLKLLWVVHNHPSGNGFNSTDLDNGSLFANSTKPQLSSFQGIILGLPDGSIQVRKSSYFRGY